jgi:DNA polymerase III delta prime subunit
LASLGKQPFESLLMALSTKSLLMLRINCQLRRLSRFKKQHKVVTGTAMSELEQVSLTIGGLLARIERLEQDVQQIMQDQRNSDYPS